MFQPLFRSLILALPLTVLVACSDNQETSSPSQPATDAASDSQQEAATEASVDAAPEDAAADSAADASSPQDAAQLEAGEDSDPGQDSQGDVGQPAQLGAVSVADLATELADKDFLLINVHVPYAGEIPLTDANLTYEDVPAIEAYLGADQGKKVVLYCYSNYMSTLAGNQLAAKGYWNVRYLDGGLAAWKNAGQPVEYHDQ